MVNRLPHPSSALAVKDGRISPEWYKILGSLTTDLESRITTIEGDITTIEGDITTIEGDITTIEGDITAIEDDVAAIDEYLDVYDSTVLAWVAGSGNDNTSIYNAAIANAVSAGKSIIQLPAGNYFFTDDPDTLPNGMTLRGWGRWATIFDDDKNRNDDDEFIGIGFACVVENLVIEKSSGKTGGIALGGIATASPDRSISTGSFRHIYISGVGTFSYGVRLDGRQRTIDALGSTAIGVRQFFADDVQCFQATIANWTLQAVQSGQFSNCHAVPTTTPSVADLYISGDNDADPDFHVPSQNISFDGSAAWFVRFDNCSGCIVNLGTIVTCEFIGGGDIATFCTVNAGSFSNPDPAVAHSSGFASSYNGTSCRVNSGNGTFSTDDLQHNQSVWAHSLTAIPAGGTAGAGLLVSATANFGVFFGSGAPTLGAAKGSLYLRSDGSGTGDRAYINTNGSTTWTALTTAA